MYSFFQKSFTDYEEKMNRMIQALEDEAYYLRQINDKLSRISDEWQAVKDSLRHINNDIGEIPVTAAIDTGMTSQSNTTEKEMEELILYIVKEVNTHNIEFVCLN
jgi:septation ring formation regulator EzrA